MLGLLHRFGAISTAFLFGLFASPFAVGQDFPNKPLRIIVAGSPGGTNDLTARIMGTEMGKLVGQAVIVENKAGATSLLGYEYAAKGVPADGYTMACVLVGEYAVLPVSFKDLRFDPAKDLVPFIGFAESRYPLLGFAGAPWKTFREMAAYAKANPGKLNYGSTSVIGQLHGAAIFQSLGLNVVFIPYKSAADYFQALGNGDIHMAFAGENSAITLGPKVRVLAETGAQRSPNFPDAPTFAELGHPQLLGIIQSLSVPAGVPKPVFDRLNSIASRALRQPDTKAALEKIRFDVVEQSPEAAAKTLADTLKLYSEVAGKIGLKPQ